MDEQSRSTLQHPAAGTDGLAAAAPTVVLLSAHRDLKAGWIDRLIPAPARPYLRLMRVDRPIGMWLRLFPGWWALALAAERLPTLELWLIFWGEAVLTRGLGCTVNDIVDRDIDAKVARTRNRPLASGEVTVGQAAAFLGLQILLGALLLARLGGLTLGLFAATVILACIYPLMKRVTFWPQAFLGVVFNTSALMSWAAVQGTLSYAPLLLYAGCFFWTLGYDTIYAHQDKVDDARLGVKSTALHLGAASRKWVGGFFLAAVALWGAALTARGPLLVALLAVLAPAGHLAWQLRRWDPDSPALSLAMFKSNQNVGWLLLAGIVLLRLGAQAHLW